MVIWDSQLRSISEKRMLAPGPMSALNPGAISDVLSRIVRLFWRVEGSGFHAADLAVHLSATIPHGTNSMGDS
ncbi:hypothetical protein AUI06_12170 [archaeon 13_2_20CM_2_52_21]|nr:MAG: hypothetical protein AUI06_12170 [archaeon 13_2_20CM_2_52_21]